MNDTIHDDISGPEETTLRWFGDLRPRHLDKRTKVPVPVGENCLRCTKPIAANDFGYTIPEMSSGTRRPHHYSCFMESILGPEWDAMMADIERRRATGDY